MRIHHENFKHRKTQEEVNCLEYFEDKPFGIYGFCNNLADSDTYFVVVKAEYSVSDYLSLYIEDAKTTYADIEDWAGIPVPGMQLECD